MLCYVFLASYPVCCGGQAVIGAMYEHSVHSPPGSPHTLAAAPGLGLGLGEGGGVTVIVQQMVYGNLNHNSGSGVCFSRHPREPVTEPVDPGEIRISCVLYLSIILAYSIVYSIVLSHCHLSSILL